MRGAFESFLLFLLGMTFVLLGFSMVEVTFNYNRARLFQETIITLIERHDRYDDDVRQLIYDSKQNCQQCQYDVRASDNKFLVEVMFDINISVLNYRKKASVVAYTQSLQ